MNNKNRNITPKPSGFTLPSEAPPPPALAPVERFVPTIGGTAPAFPILGRSTDNESTPRTRHSIVPTHSLIAVALLEFAEIAREREEVDVDALVASNTNPCNQLQTLEPSSSESSDDTPTPFLPLLPCGDHLPSFNHRYHQARSTPFLKPRKAKTFDELIDETVKA